MENDSNRLRQICDNVLARIISSAIIALITGLVTYCVSIKFEFTKLEVWLMVIVSVLFIFIVTYFFYRITNRNLPVYGPIDCDFRILREERIHRWVNENEYIHKRRYTLQAKRNGLTEYVDKFRWTGSGYTLSGGNDDYTVSEDSQLRNVFTVYRFKFSKPLKKRQIIRVEAQWLASGPAEHFFSTTIEEPTDYLVMKVALYPGSKVKKVNCEVCPNIGAKLPKDIFSADLDSDGEFSWEVPKPKFLHHYEINWK